MNDHILLVEDNKKLMKANRRYLELKGYRVSCAENVAQASQHLSEEGCDLIVLDIMLPDGSGLDFCAEVRSRHAVPILFLTALDGTDDIVRGLASGGDDYLAKPFRYEELLARIAALLARVRRADALAAEHMRRGAEVYGSLRLDILKQRAYYRDADLLLKPKEFMLLHILAARAPALVTGEELYRAAWGWDGDIESSALHTHIYRLRKKLPKELEIELSRSRGYRLVGL